MSLDDFIAGMTGRRVGDGECGTLCQAWWGSRGGGWLGGPTVLDFAPLDASQPPQPGDIVVWGPEPTNGIGQDGHAGIFYGMQGGGYRIFNQNNPAGAPAAMATLGLDGYRGAVHINNPVAAAGPGKPPMPAILEDPPMLAFVIPAGKQLAIPGPAIGTFLPMYNVAAMEDTHFRIDCYKPDGSPLKGTEFDVLGNQDPQGHGPTDASGDFASIVDGTGYSGPITLIVANTGAAECTLVLH